MNRFEQDRYYKTDDPALAVIGTRGTLAQWRHRGEGPPTSDSEIGCSIEVPPSTLGSTPASWSRAAANLREPRVGST